MGDREDTKLKCVLPITPRLQHSSFPACWPLHKPFWEGKIHFSRSLEEQHCTHFTKFCLRSVRQSISCAPLSGLYSLKAENQFHLLISFLPAFLLYTCRGSRSVTFIHHLCISSLTVFRLLPGITRLIFFNLFKKPYITTTLLSARPNMELAKSHCSAVSTDVQLKVIWKEQEREWEREHDKRQWRRKEKAPENDEKCSCHCRYLPRSEKLTCFLAACNTYKPWN